VPDLEGPLPIAPRGALDARVRVPGSKSITNRALVVAALADGDSHLEGTLDSDDTRVMRSALGGLGVDIQSDTESCQVRGRAGVLHHPTEPLFAGNSGTTARFLTAAAALADGPVVIDGNARMRQRPIADLALALGALGVRVEVLGSGGCPPVRIHGPGFPGGRATIDATRSSQYVSAVLLSAPYAQQEVVLELADGVCVSRPYVELTLQVMRAFGAEADWSADGGLRVAPGRYRGREYAVEPDASSAVYPLCAAAIAGGRVRVDGLPRDSVQADLALLPILEQMGCAVHRGSDYVELQAPQGRLRAVDVDTSGTWRTFASRRPTAWQPSRRSFGRSVQMPVPARIPFTSPRGPTGARRSRPTTTTGWRWPLPSRGCAFRAWPSATPLAYPRPGRITSRCWRESRGTT
jgi:3-phosphoshikimate 1-carboxyvinyltransferase